MKREAQRTMEMAQEMEPRVEGGIPDTISQFDGMKVHSVGGEPDAHSRGGKPFQRCSPEKNGVPGRKRKRMNGLFET
jgi:hypothetical protein